MTRYSCRMSARTRDRVALVVAVAAHAVAFVWGNASSGGARPMAPGPFVAIETAIDVDPLPPELPPAPTAPSEPSPTIVPSHVRAGTASVAQGRSPTSDAAAGPAIESADPGAMTSWTFSPTRPQTDPDPTRDARALATATKAVVAAVLAEADRKAADRVRRPRVFAARDMDLGLAPGNQYVAMTRDRVRSSLVPMNGHALLEFWTDNKGIVARIRVVNPSSDSRAWNDVAKALEEDARSTPPLKIPSNADGFIVTLDVTSVLRTLSGETPSPGAIAGATRAITNPVDAVIDAKASPRRVVTAKVARVEAF